MSIKKNQFVDTLVTLALMAQVVTKGRIQPIDIEVRNLQAHYCPIKESLYGKQWYNDIKRFLQHREYPQKASKTYEKTLRRMAMNFYMDREILYKRSFDKILLRCLN